MNEHVFHAREIFAEAVAEVDPEKLIHRKLILCQEILAVATEGGVVSFDLSRYATIYVVGVGKASAKMALGVESILGERITDGIVAVKYGHTEPTAHVRLIEAGHPVPDANSVRAAGEIVRMCTAAGGESLVINLISGGGSALMCSPRVGSAITLEDKQAVTGALLACGAEIQEINCIRKHLSNVKGGQLAQALYPADSLSLILSDVVGDPLDAIASGLTVADPSTFSQALRIIKKYAIGDQLPQSVMVFLQEGEGGGVDETPNAAHPAFSKTRNVLLGANYQALKAASNKASALGYHAVILSSQITGEAREVAKFYLGIAADQLRHKALGPLPFCIIAGGETTVTLKGTGLGGRNQEMALAFMNELRHRPDLQDHVFFLSGATDGNDGPTDAAGGIVTRGALDNAAEAGLDLQAFLDTSDSYNALEQSDALLKTGPTNTNVCDIQILLVV